MWDTAQGAQGGARHRHHGRAQKQASSLGLAGPGRPCAALGSAPAPPRSLGGRSRLLEPAPGLHPVFASRWTFISGGC